MTTLAAIAVIWLGAIWIYVIAMAARTAQQSGILTKFWLVHLAPLVLVGLILDVLFNMTFGWMFLDLPREFLFSSRVERHYRNSNGWRLRLSKFWARNLNVFDSKHITRR